jgi:hypothetical protein
MYTHARQFPHLAGMTDEEIRELARRSMDKRPDLVRMMKFRNVLIILGMVIAAALLARFTDYQISSIFMIVGAVSTVATLTWNMVWVNIGLFRTTRDEIALTATK